MTRLRAYCELLRLPNVFTAPADVLAGYWLVSDSCNCPPSLRLLLAASACLYAAGIVFNDLADIEVDRRERPARPLPSGSVSPRSARRLAIFLSMTGILLASLASLASMNHRVVVISLCLLCSILLYDFVLKSTLLGPCAMAACRTLNLSLGMLVAGWQLWDARAIALIAMFLYVASFTFFGRQEASQSTRSRLIPATVGLLAAVVLLGFFVLLQAPQETFTMVLWLALLIHFARVALRAIRHPSPAFVQYAMKTFVLGIIAFDAVIACSAHGWPAGVTILALLVPALFLGRRLYST